MQSILSFVQNPGSITNAALAASGINFNFHNALRQSHIVLENDIRRYRASEKYSYLAALASHERDRAAAQIQAVKDAGGNAAKKTFPDVRRQDERSSEAGTFLCDFEGCTNVYKTFDGLVKHVKHEKRGYGRTGSAATAKAPTHVGYTPKAPKRGDLPAGGQRSHKKKTWDEDV
jgi:hypothetical protein